MEVRIGTSGWNYPHWRGAFYPPGLPSSKWLEFYAHHFDTVEINATFYGRPKPSTFEKWYQSTPPGFLFAVKASRYITHIKRLKNVKEPISRLYQDITPLREKLGAILFQLPPNLAFDEKQIKAFLELLDTTIPTAIEVRHESFHTRKFFQLLEEHNVAFCISDTAGKYPSLAYEITADFTYIRLHGSRVLYASCYTREELETWARRILSWGVKAYVYFDNDAHGYAPQNARELKEILKSFSQTGTPIT
jgi:uncharacterized protein YecE (DUF72 family)